MEYGRTPLGGGTLIEAARVFADADLLIAATAAFHGQEFATSEAGLAEGLRLLALPVAVPLVPIE